MQELPLRGHRVIQISVETFLMKLIWNIQSSVASSYRCGRQYFTEAFCYCFRKCAKYLSEYSKLIYCEVQKSYFAKYCKLNQRGELMHNLFSDETTDVSTKEQSCLSMPYMKIIQCTICFFALMTVMTSLVNDSQQLF